MMKKIINFRNVFKMIREKRNEKFNDKLWELKLRETEKQADITGKTHWLVVGGDGLVVVNRDSLKDHNRKNRESKISAYDLDQRCLYKVDGKGIKRNIEIKTKK